MAWQLRQQSNAGSSPLLSADGTKPIKDKDKILERWTEQFVSVLNRPSINDKAIERLSQVPMNESLDITPTLGEVHLAIQLSSRKPPGSDLILVEIYKEGGSAVTSNLLTLIQLICLKEQLPLDFKDASITNIYKPEFRCGFYETIDIVFAARQLQEKCQE